MRLIFGFFFLALAACVPAPGERQITPDGIRPGVSSSHDFRAVRPPVGTTIRYSIRTPLREQPSEMVVIISKGNSGQFIRSETVRIPGKSATDARTIATMVRQRNGRRAQIDGTDVIVRNSDRIDRRSRMLSADEGPAQVTYAPHDCHATPGLCRMTRTDPDGTVVYLVANTSETSGVWSEEVRYDPERDPEGRDGLVRQSVYSIDESAQVIDVNQIRYDRTLGKYQEIRRVE